MEVPRIRRFERFARAQASAASVARCAQSAKQARRLAGKPARNPEAFRIAALRGQACFRTRGQAQKRQSRMPRGFAASASFRRSSSGGTLMVLHVDRFEDRMKARRARSRRKLAITVSCRQPVRSGQSRLQLDGAISLGPLIISLISWARFDASAHSRKRSLSAWSSRTSIFGSMMLIISNQPRVFSACSLT